MSDDLKNKSWAEVAEIAKSLGLKAWRRVPTGNTVKIKKCDLIEAITRIANRDGHEKTGQGVRRLSQGVKSQEATEVVDEDQESCPQQLKEPADAIAQGFELYQGRSELFEGTFEQVGSYLKHDVEDGQYTIVGNSLWFDCERVQGVVGPNDGGIRANLPPHVVQEMKRNQGLRRLPGGAA